MRIAAAMIIAMLPCAALANGQQGGGGSTSYAGAAASASARASASSASISGARAMGGNAAAYGGSSAGYGGAGGNSTVINSVGNGRSGSWWQGTSPTVIAPGMVSNGTCSDSVSFGLAFGPGGLSFGVPARNADCNIREYAKVYLLIGRERHTKASAAAWRVMCLSPEAKQAGVCQ